MSWRIMKIHEDSFEITEQICAKCLTPLTRKASPRTLASIRSGNANVFAGGTPSRVQDATGSDHQIGTRHLVQRWQDGVGASGSLQISKLVVIPPNFWGVLDIWRHVWPGKTRWHDSKPMMVMVTTTTVMNDNDLDYQNRHYWHLYLFVLGLTVIILYIMFNDVMCCTHIIIWQYMCNNIILI